MAAWRARPQRISRTYGAAARPVRLREEWPNLTLYIEEALISVLVDPANGRTRWKPDRLGPLWRPAD
ncbi:hypothetical protein GCM10009678_15160 [Actinomadura kijaniata]